MDKKRLLVIDDEIGPRESLRYLFKDLYEVVCVESVDAGIREMKQQPPDCVITDIKMPGKSGIQGLQEMREIDPQVSIVMLTGYGSLDTAQEAIRHGATDYLKKPFDMHEMRESIAKYIRRTRFHRARADTLGHLESIKGELREHLEQRERLAALGENSFELVHDLSSPMSVILGYVQILINEMEGRNIQAGEMNIAYLEQIEKSATRCSEMLTLWRERSRQMKTSVQPISIAPLVMEVVGNVRARVVAKDGRIDIEEGPEDCVMEGDNLQVFRALQNIVGNAAEALPATGGVIHVGWQKDEDKVWVEVRDNGPGFAPEKLADVRSRYYTTKGETGGMGLGLFITRNVVEAHDGSLILSTSPSGGALVRLEFPLKK